MVWTTGSTSGYRPAYLVFPNFLRAYARWILQKNPEAVVFDDGIVMRFQADCGGVIAANSRPSGLQHFRHVQRHAFGESEHVVGVDESGRYFRVGEPIDEHFENYMAFESDMDVESDEERPGWDLCECGVELSYCEACDNEVCPECNRGCTCDQSDDDDFEYSDDEGEEEDEDEPGYMEDEEGE